MSHTISLTDSEVTLLASALAKEFEHNRRMRAFSERQLADPASNMFRTAALAAAREERQLAAVDSLIAKLPDWVGTFVASVTA